MRTTLNIPEDLMNEAVETLGFMSKTDVVIVALRELIRKKRIEELKGLAGELDVRIDVARSRRRPTGGSKRQ